jgi:hypothetical protein
MADDMPESQGGGERSAARGRRRFRGVLLAVVMLGLVAVGSILAFRFLRHGRPYQPPPLAYEGDSTGLKQTVIVPTLDTPVPPGKNVIWCSSFQVAWDHLKADVIKAPVKVANAEEVADRLNRAPESESDLPEGFYYATAGFVTDGIISTIQKEMAAKFPLVPAPVLGHLSPDALVAYAYLTASVKFTIPFFDSNERLSFQDSTGGKGSVSAFGIRPEDEYAYSRLREQVEVLYAEEASTREEYQRNSESRGGMPVPLEFALDPCKDSSAVQLLLATVGAKESLAEKKIREWSPATPEYERVFQVSDVLLVPNVFYKVRHRFSELEGPGKVLLNPGFSKYWVEEALQSVEFKLDRSGAEVASQAEAVVRLSALYFLFDRSFLIVLRKRGAEHPFFVMWVDNAELLCKWHGPPGGVAGQ